ncbi:4'-phosphopantetheinyl transferase [Paenibacillus curdlanolyticus YK9]|uniref:4'-phosphopantetheinyl transferase n=1 Tax=Paenibacillus curdlanolyticus YK9 TaxID=717606 RepID=E0IA53_9BACL|nr:4'-phosphopantetheinyl transferase superfamily protein [Paenibacillus curdlanolyticus]EFM10630.1 4'-phosphopantetheinyl transferase [Paenibacillus curdlanolyticus YK9]
MVELFAVRIEQRIREADLAPLIHQVSEARQAQIKRYRFQDDAIRSLFSELLIRRVLREKYNIDNDDIVFSFNTYGKPTIAGPIEQQYNVSHAGSWIVGAISALPVGIDVEAIKPIDMAVAHRFFSSVECGQLAELTPEQQQLRFYELWTLKESYIKAVGKGLSLPLNSFSFRFQADEGRYQLKADNGDDDYEIRQFDLDSDYRLALCSKEREINRQIHQWSTSDWL